MLKNPTIYIRIYMPFIEERVFGWDRLFAVGDARASRAERRTGDVRRAAVAAYAASN